jgi:NarL family two-component system response regulator LiaR
VIRIVLVDDDPSARFIIRTILGDEPDDFEIVSETGRASEAMELIDGCTPDIVLLDARMPLIDGYELAGQIRDRCPQIGLVLLSSFVDEEVRRRAREAGIHACLDKGDFDAVPRVLREVASREPGATAAPG